MAFTMRKSVHGRRLGLSTTGGVITDYNSTGRHGSTLHEMSAQMWGPAMLESIVGSTLVGTTLSNIGVSVITSSTSILLVMEIEAPVAGCYKEIHIATSASEASLGGTADTTIFRPVAAGAGSSVFMADVNLANNVLTLRGMSSVEYSVVNYSAVASTLIASTLTALLTIG